MSGRFTESVEVAAPAWLEGQGYTILHGPDIAPRATTAEREDCGQHDCDSGPLNSCYSPNGKERRKTTNSSISAALNAPRTSWSEPGLGRVTASYRVAALPS